MFIAGRMANHSMIKGKLALVPFPFDDLSSAIRLHRLMTVTTSLIQRELGNLSSQMEVEVNEKLPKLFEY
jgi:hypothetical protein